MDKQPFGLGAHRSPVDNTRILHNHLNASVAAAIVNYATVDYSKDEVLNQGKKGICTAISLAKMLSKMFGFKVSWVFLYKMGKRLEGNTDEGAALIDMLRAAFKLGVPHYELAPYDINCDYATFMAQPDFSPAVYADAALHKLPAYAQVLPLNKDTLIQALSTSKYGLYTRIEVGDEFWTDKNGNRTYDPALLQLIRTPQTVISGHAIVTETLDYRNIPNTGIWGNSWGDGWCDHGNGAFDADAWIGTYLTEAWVISDKFIHSFDTNLVPGYSGDEVIALQTALKLDGEFKAPTTGWYGPLTFAAVRAFQTKYGITPLGIVGPKTRAQLNSLFSS